MPILLHKEIATPSPFDDLVSHAKVVYNRHRRFKKWSQASLGVFSLLLLFTITYALMGPSSLAPVHHVLHGYVHLQKTLDQVAKHITHGYSEITLAASVAALLMGAAMSVARQAIVPMAVSLLLSVSLYFAPSVFGGLGLVSSPSSTTHTSSSTASYSSIYAPALLSANHLAILSQKPNITLNARQHLTFSRDIRWLESHPHAWYVTHGTRILPYDAVTHPLNYLSRLEMTPRSPHTPAVRHYIAAYDASMASHARHLRLLSYGVFFSLAVFLGFFVLSIRFRASVMRLIGSMEAEEADLLRLALNIHKQNDQPETEPSDDMAMENA